MNRPSMLAPFEMQGRFEMVITGNKQSISGFLFSKKEKALAQSRSSFAVCRLQFPQALHLDDAWRNPSEVLGPNFHG